MTLKMSDTKGVLLVVSGPSGVGKGTICAELIRQNPEIHLAVSATSRKPRAGEIDGVHYYFKSKEEFNSMIEKDELLEYVNYGENSYGTPTAEILDRLDKGENVILEIEMRGGMNVKKKYPNTITVFVVPPSHDELVNRLTGRGTESEEEIIQRLNIAKGEFEYIDYYDYLLVNDSVDAAVGRLKSIIVAENCRKDHIINNIKKELKLL